ncbi:DUF1851 domain-containing protein [Flammeovirga yaeyamensis]|uniref:DUF1851 domain-containing protein n=1 Tax=Flammeovirga yaeyamensis TaxID=367791 RepID=A0AAX1NDC1_9BACT|nr:T6SS immunity protein Tdi1 domain-containing protein [Flammeovirga yaeyamensis]MBB3696573.1 hypothetical protein [Flammeovirga yaeyamensis]NMF33251.1 DUF1851 domain-containing protein [Flammeovirga yaeyamensis]QWG05470.1 DUF1851 domain-containing protein [Flammeovirga yaeyamensis]
MNNFLANFELTHIDTDYKHEYTKQGQEGIKPLAHINQVLEKYGGSIIENGFFRIHTFGSSIFWLKEIVSFFKIETVTFIPFAYDFYGRQYASNVNDDTITMFDPSDGEKYFLDNMPISEFFNEFVVENREEPCGYSDFKSLSNLYGEILRSSDCLGFKKLLFLGGEDELENLEVQDMEMYWELNKQLKHQTDV